MFIAEQIDALPESIEEYLAAERNRQRHVAELQDRLGFRPFGTRPAADLAGWLLPHAIENDRLRDGLSAGGRRIRTFRPSQDHCFSELVEPCAGRRSLDNSSLGRDRGRTCPKPVTPRCLPEYLRRVGRGKGTFRAAARANLTRRSTDDGRPKVAPSSYRFSTPMPLSAFVSTVARCPCAAGSPERFRSRRMQSASCGAGVRAARGNRS